MTPSPSWPETSGAPPVFATTRDTQSPSDGPLIATIAASLGTPLLPWQRYVADVAGERKPDGSYRYRTVVISVPRQTGKTTLIRAMGVQRALMGRSVFYTAQTGQDARARWEDLVEVLKEHPALGEPVTKVALRGGSEHIKFPSGARFQVFAPTPKKLHGYTIPTIVLDEAFAHDADLGELLMGAIKPAQQTLRDKQLWIVSTRGTAESTFFHDWLDRAIEGAPGVAGFYWGAREDQDPFDVDDIAAFHPGVGFELGDVTLTPAAVLAEAEGMSRAEYVRAYGNKITVTAAGLIEPEAWATMTTRLAPPADLRDITLVYDVAAHRTSASIVAVWTDHETGLPAVKIVRREPGSSWLADAVVELDNAWRPTQLVAVGNGPVLDVTADIVAAGSHVDALAEREYAAACGAFLDLIQDAGLVHDGDGDDPLTFSVVGLVARTAAVDGIAFSRRHSAGDSSAGIAAAAGLYAHRENRAAAPTVRFSA